MVRWIFKIIYPKVGIFPKAEKPKGIFSTEGKEF